MQENQKTAVEWLHNEIYSKKTGIGISILEVIRNQFNDLFDQAKEMEKQQIIDARVNGVAEGIDIGSNPITEDISKNHEIYYNETLKQITPIARISAKNIMADLKENPDGRISYLSQVTYHQQQFYQKLNEAKWRINKVAFDLGGEFELSEDLIDIKISEDKDHILFLKESLIIMNRDLGDIYSIIERLELLTSK